MQSLKSETQPAQIALNQREQQILRLIEQEDPNSPISQVFDLVRDQISGDALKKNQLLARRMVQFFMTSIEKWPADMHFVKRRQHPIFLPSIDPSKLIFYGTDFLSTKQLKKSLNCRGFNSAVIQEIKRLDKSHHAVVFSNKVSAIQLIKSLVKEESDLKEIKTSEQGEPANDKDLHGRWFKLWAYQYYSKERMLQARFSMWGESDDPENHPTDQQYEHAKAQMLKKVKFNINQSCIGLIDFNDDQGQINEREEEESFSFRKRERSRSREKKFAPSKLQQSNYEEENSNFFDRCIEKKTKFIEEVRLKAEKSMMDDSRDVSLNASNFGFRDIEEQLSMIDSNRQPAIEPEEQNDDGIANFLLEDSDLARPNVQQPSQPFKKKIDVDKCLEMRLEDLSELDEDDEEQPDPKPRAAKFAVQKQEVSQNMSLMMPQRVNSSNNDKTFKSLDLSNLNLEDSFRENKKQHSNILNSSQSSRPKERQLYQKSLNKKSKGPGGKKNNYSAKFNYRNYSEQKLASERAGGKKREVVDLTDD